MALGFFFGDVDAEAAKCWLESDASSDGVIANLFCRVGLSFLVESSSESGKDLIIFDGLGDFMSSESVDVELTNGVGSRWSKSIVAARRSASILIVISSSGVGLWSRCDIMRFSISVIIAALLSYVVVGSNSISPELVCRYCSCC